MASIKEYAIEKVAGCTDYIDDLGEGAQIALGVLLAVATIALLVFVAIGTVVPEPMSEEAFEPLAREHAAAVGWGDVVGVAVDAYRHSARVTIRTLDVAKRGPSGEVLEMDEVDHHLYCRAKGCRREREVRISD